MALSQEFSAEILGCLRRSGYLLESRIIRALTESRFFVQPNIALIDRRTGKSRELDIVAEYFDYDPNRPNLSVRTEFVIEAINNFLPLILMTPEPYNPLADVEAYIRYGTTPSEASFLKHVDVHDAKGVSSAARYSQYCALTRKKSGDELMASHPDDLYSSLLKLAEFIEDQVAQFNVRDWQPDEYWRLWFWEGLLVVGGDLLVVDDSGADLSLREVESAPLIFNFHVGEAPRTLVIQVIRESALMPYLTSVIAVDREIRNDLFDARGTAT